MAPRIDPITEELLARVTWEWQDVEPLIRELTPLVPPGKALRAYEQNRASVKRRLKPTVDPTRALTSSEQITSGARDIVNDRISSQRESGRVEVEGDRRTGRRIRFRERRAVGSAPQPAPVQEQGASEMFGSGEAKKSADDALAQVGKLQEAWNDLRQALEVWREEILAEVREAQRKQAGHADSVRGQVESLNSKLSVLDPSGTEALETQVNSLRVDINALRETVTQLAGLVSGQEQAMTQLVARLTGALSASGVFGEQRTGGRHGH